ncbi:MAG: hypothetical protein Q9P90_19395 [candidate division KSB1 bacterium]|nr:hypothetical protein [candidate division KSB1 bacterium]
MIDALLAGIQQQLGRQSTEPFPQAMDSQMVPDVLPHFQNELMASADNLHGEIDEMTAKRIRITTFGHKRLRHILFVGFKKDIGHHESWQFSKFFLANYDLLLS